MRTIPALATVAAMLATAMPSQAWAKANWVFVSQNSDRSNYFVDRNSLRRVGSFVRFWQRTDYVNSRDGWRQTKGLREDNCATSQYRYLQLTFYYVDGQSATEGPAGRWENVVPDTPSESVHDLVCRR